MLSDDGFLQAAESKLSSISVGKRGNFYVAQIGYGAPSYLTFDRLEDLEFYHLIILDTRQIRIAYYERNDGKQGVIKMARAEISQEQIEAVKKYRQNKNNA